jgi:outer membrane protein assembly factor BamB
VFSKLILRETSKNKSRTAILTLFFILIMGASPLLAAAQTILPQDAPVQGQNLQRTYYSDGTAPNSSNLLWRFHMNSPPGEFACVVVDGVVYQGCLGTGDVYAIGEANGNQIWHINLNNTANSLTYYNGLIITQGGSLPYDAISRSFGDEWIALDAQTGAIVWIYQIPQSKWIAPDAGTYGMSPIVVDGKMYVSLVDRIATLNVTTGKEIDSWGIVSRSFYDSYDNGTIYGVLQNQTDNKFYAFSGDLATKTLNWVSHDNPLSPFGYSDVGWGTFSGIALSDDLFVSEYNFSGTVNTNFNPNRIFRIRANDGALAWVFPTVGYASNNIAVAYNNVYAATSAGNVYAVSKTEGTAAVWTKQFGPVYAPIVVADQKVFFGSEDTYVYALDAATGETVWKYRTGGAVIGTCVVADGNLFVASKDQYLYAFGPLPAKTPSKIAITAPTYVPTGQGLTIHGRLTDSNGAPIVLASVTIQQRLVPRTEYTDIATVATDANGNYSVNWFPTINAYYDLNAVYSGDGSGPSSAAVTISVGGTETIIDALNRVEETMLVVLGIIAVLAVVAVVLSGVALASARTKKVAD